jgi:UDP-N-acetylmuramoyl-tripeptide--D-alanyl-D-alanine ligase
VNRVPPNLHAGRDPLDPRAWAEEIGATVSPDARPATAITFDSRQVNATTAFAALRGERAHGNDYIAAALEMDAPFILTDLETPRGVRVADATRALRAWARAWRDASGATLVGITGSAGKTTAKEFVAAALEAGKTAGSMNTLNYLATYLLGTVTPASLHVIEMGIDRIGEMDELMALIAPDIGVVTSVGPAHLEFFGSLETTAYEKGRILQAKERLVSSPTAWRYPGVPSYGFEDSATHRGEDVTTDADGVHYRYAGHTVHVASPSLKVAEASVLALALAERFDKPLEGAIQRMAHLEVPGGRMRLERGRILLVDDTYNANPLSVTAALETLERLNGTRRIAVLGDMRELGDSAALYHKEIGAFAARGAQMLVAVGAHAGDYAAGARGAGLEVREFADAGSALEAVLGLVQDGDTVLVKGSRAVGLERVAEGLRARL